MTAIVDRQVADGSPDGAGATPRILLAEGDDHRRVLAVLTYLDSR